MFNINAVDKSSQNEGTWVDYSKDTSFKIAYAQNPRYLKIRERLVNTHGKGRNKTLDADAQSFVTTQSLAEGVLLDWKGVSDGKSEVEYNADVGQQALSDNPDLLDFVVSYAIDIENYRREEVEEKAKK